MPVKRDKLTQAIEAAFKSMERRICGHWAGQRQCFEAGYRAGFAAAQESNKGERSNITTKEVITQARGGGDS